MTKTKFRRGLIRLLGFCNFFRVLVPFTILSGFIIYVPNTVLLTANTFTAAHAPSCPAPFSPVAYSRRCYHVRMLYRKTYSKFYVRILYRKANSNFYVRILYRKTYSKFYVPVPYVKPYSKFETPLLPLFYCSVPQKYRNSYSKFHYNRSCTLHIDVPPHVRSTVARRTIDASVTHHARTSPTTLLPPDPQPLPTHNPHACVSPPHLLTYLLTHLLTYVIAYLIAYLSPNLNADLNADLIGDLSPFPISCSAGTKVSLRFHRERPHRRQHPRDHS